MANGGEANSNNTRRSRRRNLFDIIPSNEVSGDKTESHKDGTEQKPKKLRSSPLTPFLRCISAVSLASVISRAAYFRANSTLTSGRSCIESPLVFFSFSRASASGIVPSVIAPNVSKSAPLVISWLKSIARSVTFDPVT